MSDNVEPSQTEFNNGEQVAMDILSTAYPRLLTAAGSVLRELLIRPVAYVYAWILANFNKMFNESTMEYLQTSTSTDNETADAVASNYFVSRRSGVRSRSMITLIISSATVQIPAGSAFIVDGIRLLTERTIIGMGSRYELVNGVQYVPVMPYDTSAGTFMCGVPVVSAEIGNIECAAGADVTMGFANSSVVEALLTSPVSGGRDIETDAELMDRAEYNTANAGIGSYYGIKKKLADSPVDVLGLGVVAGEDAPMFRARYNTVGVSPGGYVDCYIKTYNQYMADVLSLHIDYDSPVTEHTIRIDDIMHSGLFAVRSLRVNGEAIPAYRVSFESSSDILDGRGARLSIYQVTVISFSTPSAVTQLDAGIDVLYMPGIHDVQTYMDTSANRFIGQSLMIKAAVPVRVAVACKLAYNGELTEDIISGIKTSMVDCVNTTPVGAGILNFSDMEKAVRQAYPGADIRLPCSMTGSMVLRDGSTTGMVSVSGVLDVGYPVSMTEWDPAICYFSLMKDDIRLETI